eukprot:5463292-Pleurochrysis_carterae.AAC.1
MYVDVVGHLLDLCAAIGHGVPVHLLLLGCTTARLAKALLKRVYAVAGTANIRLLTRLFSSIYLAYFHHLSFFFWLHLLSPRYIWRIRRYRGPPQQQISHAPHPPFLECLVPGYCLVSHFTMVIDTLGTVNLADRVCWSALHSLAHDLALSRR